MELKRTPLYESHVALGARMVPFAGWAMPVSYSGVIEEHVAVRTACGLFDVSHMGELFITGPGALGALQSVTSNDAERMTDGQCQYSLVLNDRGGVVDDVIVYRFDSTRFMICVNASNTAKVFEWLSSRVKGARVEDGSNRYAQLALQGPAALEILRPLASVDPGAVKRYHFITAKVCGVEAVVSRTGYTGEDGFELYAPPALAPKLWDCLLEAGRPYGIIPVGIGARDTLRIEMGYPLYGNELDDDTTPFEAGLGRFVSLGKGGDFIGKGALERAAEEPPKKTLIGFELIDAGVPRGGYEVVVNGERAGLVTSGTMSPMLRTGVGMAYVDRAAEPGARIGISIRGRLAAAKAARPPFYVKKKFAAVSVPA